MKTQENRSESGVERRNNLATTPCGVRALYHLPVVLLFAENLVNFSRSVFHTLLIKHVGG